VADLVRSEQAPDDVESLRARIASLEGVLEERRAEVARVKSSLDAFKVRYRQEVGLLHEELDDLERAIAEAESGERAKRARIEPQGPPPSPRDPGADAHTRYTSDGVRRLFRDVARAIHPDLARDDVTRDRRHRLMVEANRAYALGDEARLRSILQSWNDSPEAVEGDDPESTRRRLTRRIAQIEDELSLCAGDVAELQDTPMWKLKALVDDAAERGKDLIKEMVGRLRQDIMIARNRLAAIEWHP
jgi:hypothetical protein